MEKAKEIDNWKRPVVKINPELEKYRDNTPFPEKLALAKERLKNVKLSDLEALRNKSNSSH